MEKRIKSVKEEEAPLIETGVLVHREGLGYYIQPDDDNHAVVGFPELRPDELPEGFEVGDKIRFNMDPERSGNAARYSKIEPEGKLPK